MQKNTQKQKTKSELPRNPRKLPLNSEGVPSRNELSLNSFAGYCIAHPNMRFFQALTCWFGASKIGYESPDGWIDMWFMEEEVDYHIK